MVKKDETAVVEPTVETEKPGAKDKGPSSVADYLQAPRRKRKSFVILALGRGTQPDLQAPVEQFVRSNFKNMAIASPKSTDELVRGFGRQIVLVVYDDEFTDLPAGLALLQDLKKRKNGSGVPVLFLTRHPEKLIDAYHRDLLPWHEGDDYVDLGNGDAAHVVSKVRAGLTVGYKRRSRRYRVDIPMTYELLADGKRHPGRIFDMSVHGAMIKAEDGRMFQPGDQLKLHIPLIKPLPAITGDYLKVSARVRRVLIGGFQAGASFEHVTDVQLLALTQYLTNLVGEQMVRRLATFKARAAAARP